jgi:adenylyl-sulfate kinase
VHRRLLAQGLAAEWLDGDILRNTICRGLGFTKEDRDENVGRIAFLADLLTRNGIVTVVSAISPYREARDRARLLIGRFIEVYVDAPLALCQSRDGHGIYARSRNGLKNVTGVDDPYEPPLHPEVHCRTATQSIEECADAVVDAVEALLPAKHLR